MAANLGISIFKLSDVPRNASPALIQEVMNSFPMSVTASKNGNGPLTVNMNFMQTAA